MKVHIAARFSTFAILLLLAAGPAGAQVVHTRLWQTDGTVYAVAHDALHLYVGGQFGLVGPHTGGGAILDAESGTVPAGIPEVHGTVLACAGDGAGGWYLGGVFDAV